MTVSTCSSGNILDKWYCICSRFACVEFCGCAVCGTDIEFCCGHGVKISFGACGPLLCHVRDESGADAIRVTFCLKFVSEKKNN